MTDQAADDDATSFLSSTLTSTLEPRASRSRARTSVDWLIDNAEAYEGVLAALRGARRSIHVAQLAFDADCAAYGISAGARDTVTFLDVLVERAMHGVSDVRVLLNASWLLNTARPLRRAIAARGASERIALRGVDRFPHFMHAKLVLVDEREAFLLGSPFVNSYWDDAQHAPFDAKRPMRELGGRPLHDLSVRMRGPVVRDLEHLFADVWRCAGAEPTVRPRASRSDASTRVVCDAPNGVSPDLPIDSSEMLDALVAGLSRARRFIYVEHQYLTSRPIAAALAAALVREPELEIVIVLNQNPDLTAYRGWQNARLAEQGLLTHPRVGVFALWSAAEHPEQPRVTRVSQLFIHSKVIVIDDEWAAVGTSNLDGVSLGDYGGDFSGALGRRVFRGVRNVEVNLVIDSRADDAQVSETESIVELRERLWAEHLGVARSILPSAGDGEGLAAWRRSARENARLLAQSGVDPGAAPLRMVGRVLPYSTRAFPHEQLAACGVTLQADALELCYTPGWVEVHAAVHWIRNIF